MVAGNGGRVVKYWSSALCGVAYYRIQSPNLCYVLSFLPLLILLSSTSRFQIPDDQSMKLERMQSAKSFSDLISELQSSADEVASTARDSETLSETFSEFALILDKFSSILQDMKQNTQVMNTSPIRKAVESISEELKRAKSLIVNPRNSRSHVKHVEDMTHGLGRSLGLLVFSTIENNVPGGIRSKIRALYKEIMNTRFLEVEPASSSSPSQGVISLYSDEDVLDVSESNDEIIEEQSVAIADMTIEEVVLQLKLGNDEEFNFVILGLNNFVKDKLVAPEWIKEEGIVAILINRLGWTKSGTNRLLVLQVLRTLVSEYGELVKDFLADARAVSLLVKCLMREEDEERREAVGLLLSLSDVAAVRRRIGRSEGCIGKLVEMLNGDDDLIASRNAMRLLNALSSDTQNALHMAEAGYFKPLVHYLKEGSSMSKILMATALSRMELRDQHKVLLGEDGAIETLAEMFNSGKLEAKLSALNALKSLSSLPENMQKLISTGIVVPLLQLLFSVTSVLMTLREPASAILARIAQSESILVNKDVAQQMLSLLNLSSPNIQYHLLQALNSICGHPSASKVKNKMKQNGVFQLVLPFLVETNIKIRTAALNVLFTLSKDFPEEMVEQLGEARLVGLVNTISSSICDDEQAAIIGLLSNLPVTDKKITDVLKKTPLFPTLISILSSTFGSVTPTKGRLSENISGIFIRFTLPSDKKLQLFSVAHGVIPALVKLLSSECSSIIAKRRAATSLTQLSQNSISVRQFRRSRWSCTPLSTDAFCEVHDGHCSVRNTFCLVKAGAVSPLLQVLEGEEREADEAVLDALTTLVADGIWENGSNYLVKMSGAHALIKVLELGTTKAQEKSLWIMERIFRTEAHRAQYGESVEMVLSRMGENSNQELKQAIDKLQCQLMQILEV